MLIVFDTETTGLSPGQIAQISYILAGEALTAKNFFFAVDSMPYAAQAVHGLSKELLWKLSGGETFLDRAEEILTDFRAAEVICAHNLNFDMRFLRAELTRGGLSFHPRNGFCTMYGLTKALALPGKGGRLKPPRLSELMRFYGVSEKDVALLSDELFGGGTGAHDARSDTAATYICLERAVKRGNIRNILGGKVYHERREEALEI